MRRLLTLLAALTLVVSATAASAQDAGSRGESTLTVQGQATVSRAPDVASFSAGIETSDLSATAAQARNNAVYDAVRAALSRAGVPSSALKSGSYSMRYEPPPTPSPGEPSAGPAAAPPSSAGAMRTTESVARRPVNPGYGYIVSRNLVVSVDPGKVGAAIDACVGAGSTDIGGVSFDLRDHRGAWNAALAGALADADAQARSLASSGRFRIVRLKTIQAGPVPYGGGPVMFARAAPAPTEIPPSNVDVMANVTVTYVIAPK
jgi:uncharacterized protein YggE